MFGYFNAAISSAGLPIPATITVYLAGTATKASLYADAAGLIVKSNPFASDSLGRFQFFAAPGTYDVEISGTGITTYKIESISLGTPNGAALGTSFGASAVTLRNMIISSPAVRPYRNSGQSDACTDITLFVAKINAGGSGGLTSTNVPYDNDTNEGTIVPHADAFDGRIILHNITRGNSRKITAVDTVNNKITTEASVDDWADNDDIKAESQLVTGGTPRLMDLDLSAFVPATARSVLLEVIIMDSGGAGIGYLHPYETFASAKCRTVRSQGAGLYIYQLVIVPCISQKICIAWDATGAGTLSFILNFIGWTEDANT